MKFARQQCDKRAMQTVMQDDAFALHAGNTLSPFAESPFADLRRA